MMLQTSARKLNLHHDQDGQPKHLKQHIQPEQPEQPEQVVAQQNSCNNLPTADQVSRLIQQLVDKCRQQYELRLSQGLSTSKVAARVDGYMRALVADEQRYCCGICKQLFSGGFHIDHRMPQHLGGTSDRSNLWALCTSCHSRKTLLENSARVAFEQTTKATHNNPKYQLADVYQRMLTKSVIGASRCLLCNVVYSRAFEHVCKMQLKSSMKTSYKFKQKAL